VAGPIEESETGEEAVPATLLIPSALCVKVEYLQGAPSPAWELGRGGGGGGPCNHVTSIVT